MLLLFYSNQGYDEDDVNRWWESISYLDVVGVEVAHETLAGAEARRALGVGTQCFSRDDQSRDRTTVNTITTTLEGNDVRTLRE